MKHQLLIMILVPVIMISCRNVEMHITSTPDYEKYMQLPSADSMISLQKINTDISFWTERLKKNPGDVVSKVSLAGLYSARFKVTGDINDIHVSDRLYLNANTLFKTSTSSIYRSLATNCITQHKFQQAKLYLDTALSMGDDRYLTLLMICDVAMELGDLSTARQTLKQIANKNGFDYLIREAKLLDHSGDLEGAINKMEAATQKAIESKNDVLYLWAKSNLGDMYGHANRYSEAYQCYLNVLEKKPDYLYALKGIAWLAFSHDKNAKEAKKILGYLSKLHPIPDYDLILSEIARYENDKVKENHLLERYFTSVSGSKYGDMYNKYIFYLMIDEKKDIDAAMEIALREVNNRPTPQSFDLLSWAYFSKGDHHQALKIARGYVENKNHEPEALYHLGMIYAKAGNIKKAKYFLEQASGSSFELGPLLAEEVRSALKMIS